jgi:hypothetical protein
VAAVLEARSPVPDESVPPVEGEAEVPPLPTGLAGTVGIVEPATRWLVPGVGRIPATISTMWIMNPGAAAATVTVTPIGPEEPGPADKVLVAPGSVMPLAVEGLALAGVEGYLLVSDLPVSVSWSVTGERGVAFVAGVSVDE